MNHYISILDIIGPVMIGPSSSHTAGAARIGYEAYSLLNEEPVKIKIDLYNSFTKTGKGHKTDIAVLGGTLGISPHSKELMKSFKIAKDRKIKYEINWHERTNNEYHPNTAKILLEGKNNKVSILGYSIGGGRIQIAKINDEWQKSHFRNTSEIYPHFSVFKKSCKTNSELLKKVIRIEEKASGRNEPEQKKKFAEYWEIMKASVNEGLKIKERSKNKMFGGDGYEMFDGPFEFGSRMQRKAIAYAIAVAEYNAYTGKIVASPTAGSSGILPGVLYSIQQSYKIPDEKILEAFSIAGMIGAICADTFELAGAVEGCQAEIGVAGAMAAAAGTYIFNGNIDQIESAASLVLANLLGLTCDPIAGRVEVPCILRNGMIASMAISAIETALNGVIYPIPFDEVVDTAGRTGKLIHPCLRETSLCGLATTPTALKVKDR